MLLLVAALIAALGSTTVFLYVRGADQRARADQALVRVLKAVTRIEPGETLGAAQAAGKLRMEGVPASQVLPGAVNAVDTLGSLVALGTIYPQEQIVTAKFGDVGDRETLPLPRGTIAVSVTLSDTGRVAGFVSPGDDVAVFMNGAVRGEQKGVRLLLPRVQVVAVGATTTISTTTTDPAGAQTVEQLPATLFTLAVDQADAERVMLAATTGTLALGYLSSDSRVTPGPGTVAADLFE